MTYLKLTYEFSMNLISIDYLNSRFEKHKYMYKKKRIKKKK